MVEPSDLWAPDLAANEMCDRGACVLFHGSVQDPVWLRLMPVEHECIAPISAPCGPWSRGGRTRGFDSPHGRVFLQAIKQMRRAAPRAIATENVFSILSDVSFTAQWHGRATSCCGRPSPTSEMCHQAIARDGSLPGSRQVAAAVRRVHLPWCPSMCSL